MIDGFQDVAGDLLSARGAIEREAGHEVAVRFLARAGTHRAAARLGEIEVRRSSGPNRA